MARLERIKGKERVIYLFANHQGTPELGRTGNGNWKYRDHYTPYGEHYHKEHATSRNHAGFTGHVEDYQTGLVYMQARYYDPVLGRFLSNDPVGFADSGFDPAYFNRYAYTANDPVNNIDPDGRAAETVFDVISLGVGIASAANNISNGNFGAAAVDVAGVAFDTAAAAVPFVPGGAGVAIQASRAASAARSSNKADFMVNSDGAAVRNSPSGARADLEAGGLDGKNITNPSGTETGTIHNSPSQGADIRIMNGGPNHPPRAVTNVQGSNQPATAATGKAFGSGSQQEQRRRSHIELDPDE